MAMARCGWPAASRPGSVTSRMCFPQSRTTSRGGRSTRCRGSPGSGGELKRQRAAGGLLKRPLAVEVGKEVAFMRLVPRQPRRRDGADIQRSISGQSRTAR